MFMCVCVCVCVCDRCDWAAITDKPPKKLPRHIPMHLRKKMREKPAPKYFEVEPPSGIILPGQTMDIRIKFMPSEEVPKCTVH